MNKKSTEFIDDWIEFQKNDNPDLQWTVMAFDDLTNNDPETAWKLITNAFERIKSDSRLVGMLAAGPLEDLLVQNGEMVINEIESYVERNPEFKDCLDGVWLDKKDGVYEKIESIKNSG